ncbi:uncharacterized protein ACB058_015793 isoform 5-T5 [Synchiropus picturatus]
MEWFHCNHCKVKSRTKFAVSRCGHIFCEACLNPKQCTVCGATGRYLAITDKMKPEEKLYFKDPAKLFQSRLENIAKVSPGHFHSTGSQKITLPVAVTSPVTPHLRNGRVSGAEVSQEWYRERSLISTPGSASSHSSRSSFHEQGPVLEGTPTPFITPARVQRHTPNPFRLHFVSGLSLHSPRC